MGKKKALESPPIDTAGVGVDGFVVFNINCYNLPPIKAEAYVDRIKDTFKPLDKWQFIFNPTRSEPTTIEIHVVKNGSKKKIESYLLNFCKEERSKVLKALKDSKRIEQVKDYVLMMLGAPVIKIELDKTQLDMCVSTVIEEISQIIEERAFVGYSSKIFSLLQDGTLAMAMIMLGRIRSKYESVPGPGDAPIRLDGKTLVAEGTAQLANYKDGLENL